MAKLDIPLLIVIQRVNAVKKAIVKIRKLRVLVTQSNSPITTT